MKTIISIGLWIAAVGVALMVAYRLWRGRPVLLRGRFTPAFIRMVVIVLVAMGFGHGPDPAAGKDAGDRGGSRAPDAAAVADGDVAAAAKQQGAVAGQVPQFPFSDEQLRRIAQQWQSRFVPVLASRMVRQPGDEPRVELANANPQYAIPHLSWLSEHLQGEAPSPARPLRFWQRLFGEPEADAPLADIIAEHLDRLREGQPAGPISLQTLTAALDQIERTGMFNHWLNAYLWRRSEHLADGDAVDAAQLAALKARLALHARMADALTRAAMEAGPVRIGPQAWMSKAGPDRYIGGAWRGRAGVIADDVRGLWPWIGPGTWYRDATVEFHLTSDSATLTQHRESRSHEITEAGGRFTFGRLDVLTTGTRPAVLKNAVLGSIELPAEATITVWNLPDHLDAAQRGRIDALLAAALDDDEEAAEMIEAMLPLAWPQLRNALDEKPDAAGAARLRLIQTLFTDDTVAAPLEEAWTKAEKRRQRLTR